MNIDIGHLYNHIAKSLIVDDKLKTCIDNHQHQIVLTLEDADKWPLRFQLDDGGKVSILMESPNTNLNRYMESITFNIYDDNYRYVKDCISNAIDSWHENVLCYKNT